MAMSFHLFEDMMATCSWRTSSSTQCAPTADNVAVEEFVGPVESLLSLLSWFDADCEKIRLVTCSKHAMYVAILIEFRGVFRWVCGLFLLIAFTVIAILTLSGMLTVALLAPLCLWISPFGCHA